MGNFLRRLFGLGDAYTRGLTETGPKPGSSTETLTQDINARQYGSAEGASLLAKIFGGTVGGGGKATGSGPIRLPDNPLTVKVGATEYNAGALAGVVDAYGPDRAAKLINSGFFGQKPKTQLSVQDFGPAPSQSFGPPAGQHTPVHSVDSPNVAVSANVRHAPTTDITGRIIG